VTDVERRAALDDIGAEVAVCTRCRLSQARTKAVPGEGTEATEVIFVGEGPGFNEDRLGRPFVGQAGTLLTELLGSVGWTREEVFITNVVKCRPPENRDPEPDEIAACAPFLTRQLTALDPALVVTLGRFSMARFNPGARIGQVHGTYRAADPESGAPAALTYAMYHPAAALHQGSLKATLFRDMEGVPTALLEARKLRAERLAAAPATDQSPYQPAAGTPAIPAPASAATTAPAPAARPIAEPTAKPAPAIPGQPDGQHAESDPTDQLGLF
jgi:DNA polymerase